jgi:hypothetical protein
MKLSKIRQLETFFGLLVKFVWVSPYHKMEIVFPDDGKP